MEDEGDERDAQWPVVERARRPIARRLDLLGGERVDLTVDVLELLAIVRPEGGAAGGGCDRLEGLQVISASPTDVGSPTAMV